MVLGWLAKPVADGDLRHLDSWMAQLADPDSRPTPLSAWQRGCPEVVPGLRASAVWFSESMWLVAEPASDLVTYVAALEREFESIRDEVLALRGSDSFQEYRAPSWTASSQATSGALDGPGGAGSGAAPPRLGVPGTSSGSWNVAYLSLHNAPEQCEEALRRCPRTAAIVASAPRTYGHALLSALAPGTHIRAHVGSSNKKLRIHLPLVVPGGPGECTLTVGGATLALQAGRALVFDDSFLHEARAAHAPGGPARLTLIVDVWHPDLSAPEVRALEFLRNASLRQARLLSTGGGVPAAADFYAVLADARLRRGGSDGAVFGAAGAGGGGSGAAGAGPGPGQRESGDGPVEVEVRDD